MRTYETIFILNAELGPDAQTEQIEFYKDNIESNGGEILKIEPWGKMTLAYKIEKNTEGIYVLIQFKANTDYITELEKRFKYNELVIRYVVVMLDEKKFKSAPKKDSVRKDRRPRTDVALEEEKEIEEMIGDVIDEVAEVVEEELADIQASAEE